MIIKNIWIRIEKSNCSFKIISCPRIESILFHSLHIRIKINLSSIYLLHYIDIKKLIIHLIPILLTNLLEIHSCPRHHGSVGRDLMLLEKITFSDFFNFFIGNINIFYGINLPVCISYQGLIFSSSLTTIAISRIILYPWHLTSHRFVY